MITVIKYDISKKTIWDKFIDESRNGTFILKRDYMDYHSDRYNDFSLMFYDDKNLIAVMPNSRHETEISSHGGLTYGGIISNNKVTTVKMLEIFKNLKEFLYNQNINNLIYKRTPSIYHRYPSDEDLYALFVNNAELCRCDISTTILLNNRITFNERRRRNIKKSEKERLVFKRSFDFCKFMQILEELLKAKYNKLPVHTADEITLLAKRFPDNIKLYAAYKFEIILAGVLIFETPTVAHAQYIASSEKGRETGALDFIFSKLINEIYCNKAYFDFGISTEKCGKYLNEGLVTQKQEFGGRGIVYELFNMVIKE